VQQRLHQEGFDNGTWRHTVSTAQSADYRHAELLEAAHILPDGHPKVSQCVQWPGLCKLHHAAFDLNILGISPDTGST